MNLYLCEYYWCGNHGAYDKVIYLIFAETENVALGLALENVAKDLEEPNLTHAVVDFDIDLIMLDCGDDYKQKVMSIHQESN